MIENVKIPLKLYKSETWTIKIGRTLPNYANSSRNPVAKPIQNTNRNSYKRVRSKKSLKTVKIKQSLETTKTKHTLETARILLQRE